LVKILTEKKETIAMAESCTAGLAAATVARISGASRVFWGSFVTYTAEAKAKMLGVQEELIRQHGEVSRPVAEAMAEAALEKSGAAWAFSITGLAGPVGPVGPGGECVPIGTVWIGIAWLDGECGPIGTRGKPQLNADAKAFLFKGGRNEVREAAAAAALEALLERILTAGRI
jgi:PncC family amidohydrolase